MSKKQPEQKYPWDMWEKARRGVNRLHNPTPRMTRRFQKNVNRWDAKLRKAEEES